jgi:Na+(H+)/acetate symporter ActP
MRHIDIPLHELAFVAGTRGLAGAGVGLLLADFFTPEARKSVGWTLVAIGALTTIPIAVSLIRQSRPQLQ